MVFDKLCHGLNGFDWFCLVLIGFYVIWHVALRCVACCVPSVCCLSGRDHCLLMFIDV